MCSFRKQLFRWFRKDFEFCISRILIFVIFRFRLCFYRTCSSWRSEYVKLAIIKSLLAQGLTSAKKVDEIKSIRCLTAERERIKGIVEKKFVKAKANRIVKSFIKWNKCRIFSEQLWKIVKSNLDVEFGLDLKFQIVKFFILVEWLEFAFSSKKDQG